MAFLRTSVVALCILVCGSIVHAQSNVKTVNVTFTTIDVPGAGLTQVYGINSAGDMVGFYSTGYNDPNDHGFLLSGANFTFLDYPGADSTVATGINDSGLIVGYYGSITGNGFQYDGGSFTSVQAGRMSRTYIWGLNNTGVLVGSAGTPYTTKGFFDQNQKFKLISFPGTYSYAYATGIDNHGRVTGFTDNGAYLYTQGVIKTIEFPGASKTEADGISDSGLVVGWYESASCICGFVFQQGKYLSLSYPGAAGTFALGINISGEIVGTYTFDYQTYHGFVTNPIYAEDSR